MQNVMSAPLEAESTLTDRYQTTVPETVRRALRLKKRDKIRYTIRSSGEVVLTRAVDADADDPVLGQFLGFLAHDIAGIPNACKRLTSSSSGGSSRWWVASMRTWMPRCRKRMNDCGHVRTKGQPRLDGICPPAVHLPA